MREPVAVVASNSAATVIFSGKHMECVSFIRRNEWLYGKRLIMRLILSNGQLGPVLRPFLWERRQ